jgi:hypothetical protein
MKLDLRKQFLLPDVPVKNARRRLGRQLRTWQAKEARDLLVDVANLEPNGLRAFWRRWEWLYGQFVSDADRFRPGPNYDKFGNLSLAWTTSWSTGSLRKQLAQASTHDFGYFSPTKPCSRSILRTYVRR